MAASDVPLSYVDECHDEDTSLGPGDSVSMAVQQSKTTLDFLTHLSVTISKTPTPPLRQHFQPPVVPAHIARLINGWDTDHLHNFLHSLDAAFAQSMKEKEIDGATFLTILGMMIRGGAVQ